MVASNKSKADVIQFWRAVELFSPQPVPRIDPSNKSEPVYGLSPQTVPPWHPEHALQRRPKADNLTWRHQVYCGIFSLGQVLEVLEDRVGRQPDSPEEYPQQPCAVCSFTITNDGLPLPETLVVSTCAWASARTITPGPDDPSWLIGFDELAERIARQFRLDLVPDEEEAANELVGATTKPLTSAQIHAETARIIGQVGAHRFIAQCEVRVKSHLVSSRRQEIVDEVDSLNSFYAADLDRIAFEVLKGEQGVGLSELLKERRQIDLEQRVDVRKAGGPAGELLAPQMFPQGRWPSAADKPLFFSQQLAVNQAYHSLLGRSGIASVNGPPGTGKTTLIRDLVAALVVERAKVLATLHRPSDAFAGQSDSWTEGGYMRSVGFWIERLRGFEIVVASSNNGAVENVVLEIPGVGAVDSGFLTEDIYFADFANHLLDQPAWALVAARLGNKSNRNAFVSRFWYGNDGSQPGNGLSNGGFQDYLRNKQTQLSDWAEAVRRFQLALGREEALRGQRTAIRQLTLEIEPLRQKLAQLRVHLAERTAAGLASAAEIRSAEQRVAQAEAWVAEAIAARRLHHEFEPSVWQIIFTLGKALRRWRAKDESLQQQIDEAQADQKSSRAALGVLQTQHQTLETDIERCRQETEQAEALLALKLEQVSAAKELLGPYLLWPEDFDDPQARELRQPWADPQWNLARTELFLEALRLHRAFVNCNAARMRNNLYVAMDILSGKGPQNLSPQAARDAWTSLFFVIPVISTTFASFDRLFRHLGREELGWLLIDEGGQATPQSAVGAIWRAQRAVVLGDPLQLEPVVTLPLSVQQALQRHYGVDEVWLPGKTSLQHLADAVNPLGAYVDLRDGAMWVGTPLRVHKRCDQPMFDIANRVAYSGQMVFDTPPRPPLELRPSMWLDVTSSVADSHWIPAEGERLRDLIRELEAEGVSPSDIMLLTPFRSVAHELRRFAPFGSGMRSGTIHVAQGREADIVILVLGGNPDHPGAKRWASARPNLLNVAASRAKRRLYVIGSQSTWSAYPYFSDAAVILAEHARVALPEL